MTKRVFDCPYRREFFRGCLWVLLAAVLLFGFRALISYEDTTSLYLSLSLRSPQEGVSALYYDAGKGYNDGHVVSVFIKGDNQVHDYLYKMPSKILYHLRWDPPSVKQGPIAIEKIEILDGSQRVIRRLNLRQLAPLHQIEAVEQAAAQAVIRVQEGANDPQVDIRLDSPVVVKRLTLLARFLGGLLIESAGFLLVASLLIFLWLQWRGRITAWFHQKHMAAAVVIAISLMIFGWRCWVLYDDTGYLFLKVTMSSSVSGKAQIYYDLGQGFNELQSQQAAVTAQEEPRRYAFKLPNKAIYKLRFDPLAASGKVRIGEMKVVDAFGNPLRTIPLRQLTPDNQIQSLHAGPDGVEVIISENANDPQLAVILPEPLNFEGKLSFPFGQWLREVLAELGVVALLAFFLIWAWRNKWGSRLVAGIESPFFQEKLPLLYLASAFGLMLAMGFVSGLDVNPDEWNGHVKAASYYIENWLPPAVDDPRIVSSISVFGISYLWHIDPYYLLAVKATQLLSGIVSEFYLRLRLANAFLFLALALILITRIRRLKWIAPFLVISAQVWYLFSYFNNDAFPLFIAMLLAIQVVDSESSLNRYLAGPSLGRQTRGGVLAGILIGLLFCSKLNYLVYIVFLIFVGAWAILFETPATRRILQLKKWIFLAMVALLVYLPLYGFDQYVNDFKKDEKVLEAIERHAAPQFKPSTQEADLASTYPGLHLRDKGVTPEELFIQSSDWRDLSFKSFFGLYGYMDLLSDEAYYQAVAYVLGIFLLTILGYSVFSLPVRDALFIGCVLLFAGLVIGQSAYHSWVNDYQPQGRYLFPILPMVAIGVARLPASFRLRAMPLFGLVFFLLSLWSFLLTGLRMIPKIG